MKRNKLLNMKEGSLTERRAYRYNEEEGIQNKSTQNKSLFKSTSRFRSPRSSIILDNIENMINNNIVQYLGKKQRRSIGHIVPMANDYDNSNVLSQIPSEVLEKTRESEDYHPNSGKVVNILEQVIQTHLDPKLYRKNADLTKKIYKYIESSPKHLKGEMKAFMAETTREKGGFGLFERKGRFIKHEKIKLDSKYGMKTYSGALRRKIMRINRQQLETEEEIRGNRENKSSSPELNIKYEYENILPSLVVSSYNPHILIKDKLTLPIIKLSKAKSPIIGIMAPRKLRSEIPKTNDGVQLSSITSELPSFRGASATFIHKLPDKHMQTDLNSFIKKCESTKLIASKTNLKIKYLMEKTNLRVKKNIKEVRKMVHRSKIPENILRKAIITKREQMNEF